VDNLSLKINFGKYRGISEQPFTGKLGVPSSPTGFVGPSHLTALQTSLLLKVLLHLESAKCTNPGKHFINILAVVRKHIRKFIGLLA
jgi:hypothetical protein